MPRLEPIPHHRVYLSFDPAPVLCAWIALGTLILLLFPATQGHHPTLGWIPYWLVLAPGLSLALSRRHALTAAMSATYARARRRQPCARRIVARRRWASIASRPARGMSGIQGSRASRS
ncbi:MAG: hypothetical protein LKM32_01715 [Chiayiivirga sp.]|jgi:hypothetical protein|uniref:hypothetical protein n=1 Tax=Chiayiivirga sp. TaxID=2041042 RepID=UPI0025B96CE5|nr:hypothetical protein [Chiayiivirga sp.]MCI1711030.1 hypothetical protein [Chiayiivirga sp.]MCI1728152.1 hypothetical protein [Chiayiivirga sp.]